MGALPDIVAELPPSCDKFPAKGERARVPGDGTLPIPHEGMKMRLEPAKAPVLETQNIDT